MSAAGGGAVLRAYTAAAVRHACCPPHPAANPAPPTPPRPAPTPQHPPARDYKPGNGAGTGSYEDGTAEPLAQAVYAAMHSGCPVVEGEKYGESLPGVPGPSAGQGLCFSGWRGRRGHGGALADGRQRLLARPWQRVHLSAPHMRRLPPQ